MTFKNGNKQPRKSSTNTRALSTRISNIQREINPYIKLSGGTAVGTVKTMYVDRKTQGEFTMAAGALTVTSASVASILPTGCKILSMKVRNVTGRKIQVGIPSLNGLISNDGTASADQNFEVRRVHYAPLSQFPQIKVEIPDLVASNIDTGNATTPFNLFTLVTDGASDRVVVHFHYKQAI
jgi:hypothetical protein